MPEVSRFLGIIVSMYFDEHNPPHFHIQYDVGNERFPSHQASCLKVNNCGNDIDS